MAFLGNLFSRKPKSNLPVVDIDKRFNILGRTGQGSMSRVFRATDRNIGRTVCLKVLDKEKTARFDLRFPGLNRPMEGFICTTLKHKNIVQTYEFGLTTKGEQFLVMELIDGVGFNYLIETKNKQLDGHRVEYLIQVAEAIDYVHGQKFLHRDICPRNIMLTKEGIVKLIDFGLSLPYQKEFCKPGNRTGTPNYLAPELIKRIGTDHRVDMFALGVTAYETFTGSLPWEKTQSLQTLLSHLNMTGKNPLDFNPNLDPALVKFLIKAIERDPNKRFQTAAAFRDALRALPKQDY